MRVSLIEQAVLRPPPGMEGWRMFRIEYGGHAEACIVEGIVWLPPTVTHEDLDRLEESLRGAGHGR